MDVQHRLLERWGRHFNDGKLKGSADRLAAMLNTTPASIRNWRRPDADDQHRQMPGPALRLLLLFAVLDMMGHGPDHWLPLVEQLEQLVFDEPEFSAALGRMRSAV